MSRKNKIRWILMVCIFIFLILICFPEYYLVLAKESVANGSISLAELLHVQNKELLEKLDIYGDCSISIFLVLKEHQAVLVRELHLLEACTEILRFKLQSVDFQLHYLYYYDFEQLQFYEDNIKVLNKALFDIQDYLDIVAGNILSKILEYVLYITIGGFAFWLGKNNY